MAIETFCVPWSEEGESFNLPKAEMAIETLEREIKDIYAFAFNLPKAEMAIETIVRRVMNS